jgi:hypothetical protein
VRESWSVRYHDGVKTSSKSPRLAATSAAVVLAAIPLYLAVAFAVSWPWPQVAFRSDGSPVSWLSSVLLGACATLCLALGIVRDRMFPWWVISAGLAWMTLDEQLLLHERLKDRILYGVFAGDVDAMGRWGNAPLLAYALGGLCVIVVLRYTLQATAARRLLAAAVGVGVASLLGNVFWPDSPLKPWEEGVEVVAEALFLAALLRDL